MDYSFSYIENLKKLVRHGMLYAQFAHDCIFDENVEPFVATSYLNIAAAKFGAAEGLYYSQLEFLERGEVEDLFHLFDEFAMELLSNLRTKHSHQWTDIEYHRLKDAFDSSALSVDAH